MAIIGKSASKRITAAQKKVVKAASKTPKKK